MSSGIKPQPTFDELIGRGELARLKFASLRENLIQYTDELHRLSVRDAGNPADATVWAETVILLSQVRGRISN